MKNQASQSSSGSFLRLLAVALLGGMITLGGYKVIENQFPAQEKSAFTLAPALPAQFTSLGMPGNAMDFTVAAEVTTPAVVHVKSNIMVQTRSMFDMDPFGGGFFQDGW